MFEQRIVSEHPHLLRNAEDEQIPFLFPERSGVEARNKAKMVRWPQPESIVVVEAVDRVQARGGWQPDREHLHTWPSQKNRMIRENFNKSIKRCFVLDTEDNAGLPTTLPIAVGFPVRLQWNIDLNQGSLLNHIIFSSQIRRIRISLPMIICKV